MGKLGRPKAELVLTDDERETLQRWVARRKSSQQLALRSRIVLECATGDDNSAVAERLGVSRPTVGKWRSRFFQHRLDGLVDEARPGAPRKITDEQVEKVLTDTLETTPKNATHWSRASMAKQSGLSESTVGRIWKAFQLKPHRTETFKLSTDPQFIDKVRDVVGLYLDPPDKAVVLCVDEKSQVQALDRSQPVLPMMPGMPEKRTHDYARNGITSLFAALDMATGKVIGALRRRHRSVEYRKFLIKIDKESPRRPRRARHLRQLRHPQNRHHPKLAGRPPPPLPHPLHPHRLLLAQHGRTLVRRTHHQTPPTRRPQKRPKPRSRHPQLDRHLERRPPPLHLDQDRRRNPRQHRSTMSTN